MPQNIVLNLVTQSSISPVHLQGYSLQQLFLHLIEIVDPVLGRALKHDRSSDFYNLSALQIKPSSLKPVATIQAQTRPDQTRPDQTSHTQTSDVNKHYSLQHIHYQIIPPDRLLVANYCFRWQALRPPCQAMATAQQRSLSTRRGQYSAPWRNDRCESNLMGRQL
mgnify:CR=1 FL=1